MQDSLFAIRLIAALAKPAVIMSSKPMLVRPVGSFNQDFWSGGLMGDVHLLCREQICSEHR